MQFILGNCTGRLYDTRLFSPFPLLSHDLHHFPVCFGVLVQQEGLEALLEGGRAEAVGPVDVGGGGTADGGR